MKIAIYGLGYVGLTGAICLASEGHEVVGVDVSDDKIRKVMAGASPIKEPGLDEMLAEALAKGRLRCHDRSRRAGALVRHCDRLRGHSERPRWRSQHARHRRSDASDRNRHARAS